MSTTGLLLAVLLGLYLADCLVLLGPGQGLFRFEKRAIRLDFGLSSYVMRGRVPALLNPLTPWIPAFRTAPLAATPAGAPAPRLHPLRRGHYRILAAWPMLLVQAALMFAAVPCFLVTARYRELAIAVACAFVAAGFLLFVGWRVAADLGLGRRQYAALAFQAAVCLPLSLNLLRKLALLAPAECTALDLLGRMDDERRRATASELRFAIEAQSRGSTDPAEIARLEALQKTIDGRMG
ncbi:MAG TPA: hypothetical protein VHA35_08585 [Dongiaceae bacterium]|jgi:hypothetical protein|nr:hypothetical protein [Dongiaceae bacterium]